MRVRMWFAVIALLALAGAFPAYSGDEVAALEQSTDFVAQGEELRIVYSTVDATEPDAKGREFPYGHVRFDWGIGDSYGCYAPIQLSPMRWGDLVISEHGQVATRGFEVEHPQNILGLDQNWVERFNLGSPQNQGADPSVLQTEVVVGCQTFGPQEFYVFTSGGRVIEAVATSNRVVVRNDNVTFDFPHDPTDADDGVRDSQLHPDPDSGQRPPRLKHADVWLNGPIRGGKFLPDGGGHVLYAGDCGAFVFQLRFLGSPCDEDTGGQPIVGLDIFPTEDGAGYYLTDPLGTLYEFGVRSTCTRFGGGCYVDMSHVDLEDRPVIGITAIGPNQYRMCARDGGVFDFNVPHYGAAAAIPNAGIIIDCGSTPDGEGYWFMTRFGDLYLFGDLYRLTAPQWTFSELGTDFVAWGHPDMQFCPWSITPNLGCIDVPVSSPFAQATGAPLQGMPGEDVALAG